MIFGYMPSQSSPEYTHKNWIDNSTFFLKSKEFDEDPRKRIKGNNKQELGNGSVICELTLLSVLKFGASVGRNQQQGSVLMTSTWFLDILNVYQIFLIRPGFILCRGIIFFFFFTQRFEAVFMMNSRLIVCLLLSFLFFFVT